MVQPIAFLHARSPQTLSEINDGRRRHQCAVPKGAGDRQALRALAHWLCLPYPRTPRDILAVLSREIRPFMQAICQVSRLWREQGKCQSELSRGDRSVTIVNLNHDRCRDIGAYLGQRYLATMAEGPVSVKTRRLSVLPLGRSCRRSDLSLGWMSDVPKPKGNPLREGPCLLFASWKPTLPEPQRCEKWYFPH